MGFGFRKSFGSGPFRFTVSPSGISSSFGVRGARISSGPRGTFVTVSSHGAYYRHRIDAPRADRHPAPLQEVQREPVLDSVFQVPVLELSSSSENDLVARLNQNVAATNPAVFLLLLSVLALFLIPVSPTIAITCMVAGLICAGLLAKRFKETHTHAINYSLDTDAAKMFAAVQSAVTALSACARVWTLNTQSATSDQKRNAGAGTLITRKLATVGNLPTTGFTSSLPVSSIGANGVIFHFLPDQILLFSGKRYATVPYRQLKIELASTRYIETEAVPRDSTQVGTTWRFVNKSGGPDRRFNNNTQLPILQYGEIALRTVGGLQVLLQTSSLDNARTFTSQLVSVIRNTGEATEPPHKEAKAAFRTSVTLIGFYALLGIHRPCTSDEAAAAYRHQATLYHPDKYEHLAPEMKELAAAKMQEINTAYSAIKQDIG